MASRVPPGRLDGQSARSEEKASKIDKSKLDQNAKYEDGARREERGTRREEKGERR